MSAFHDYSMRKKFRAALACEAVDTRLYVVICNECDLLFKNTASTSKSQAIERLNILINDPLLAHVRQNHKLTMSYVGIYDGEEYLYKDGSYIVELEGLAGETEYTIVEPELFELRYGRITES